MKLKIVYLPILVFDVIIINHSPLVQSFFIVSVYDLDDALFIVAVIFDINMAFLHIVT